MSNNKNLIFNLMTPGECFINYRVLVKKLQCFSTAGLLCELVSRMKEYGTKEALVDDEGKVGIEGKWFFYTRKDIEEDFCFSEYQQRQMLGKLEDIGILKTTIFKNSIPQKKYYTLDFDKIVEFLSKK